MSIQQYERLRGAAWARLTETMDRLEAEAIDTARARPTRHAHAVDGRSFV